MNYERIGGQLFPVGKTGKLLIPYDNPAWTAARAEPETVPESERHWYPKMFAEKEAIVSEEIPKELPATRERLMNALRNGGRATVTVKSNRTGKHVTVQLAVKKKRPDGQRGYYPRNQILGRVGLAEGHTVFADDVSMAGGVGESLGKINIQTDLWTVAQNANPARAWAAEHVYRFATGQYDFGDQAELWMETKCSVCGHNLTDPKSVELGIGPECRKKRK